MSHDILFKHFEITEAHVLQLIEMWSHFNPKDEPYMIDKHTVYLNPKFPEVTPHQLMHVVKEDVFTLYWRDRFYSQGFNTRMRKPMELLGEWFTKIKGPQIVEEPLKDNSITKATFTKEDKKNAKKRAKKV